MRTTLIKYVRPKGVRRSSGGGNSSVTVYIKPGESKGVRKDHVVHKVYRDRQYSGHMLHYNKPCLCGSLYHRTITHKDCFLNPQYMDYY